MKKLLILSVLSLLSLCAFAFKPEVMTVRLADGTKVTARLCLPDEGPVPSKIVLAIHGTGAMTHSTPRGEFNYYDEMASGFCDRGIGFFSYDRRGVTVGQTPPYYHEIDSARYVKYTPLQEAEDVESMIRTLRRDKRFRRSRIILFGQSEGSIIAALVAERARVEVDGLFAFGYAHENMFDILDWQMYGRGVMVLIDQAFDKNGDGAVDRQEYEMEDRMASLGRLHYFSNLPFETVDLNKDGVIDIKDISAMRYPFLDKLFEHIRENDYTWIKANFLDLTPQWFKAHFALEPNKTRMLRLDLPIHLFHGTLDASVSVETVYDLQKRFDTCNKTNLKVSIFENASHDLDFLKWISQKEWPEGWRAIFDAAAAF